MLRYRPTFISRTTYQVAEKLDQIVETLRGRVLRFVQSGTLTAGDRLPSARTLAREFNVDFRLILNAYRVLANEGLVDLRARGGVYVAEKFSSTQGVPPRPDVWIAEVLTQALAREIRGPELAELFRRCTETLRLRAVAIASTDDQTFGLRRELVEDFGLDAEGILAESVHGASSLPLAVRRADLLVTTEAHAEFVRGLAQTLGVPMIAVEVRSDLVGGEWALLLRQPVYAVVATEEFGRMLREFFKSVPGVENLHVMVFGRDDLTAIPRGAPTYITQRVRASLSGIEIRGSILPPARTIRSESAREIFAFIVAANLKAMRSLAPAAITALPDGQ